MRKAIQIAATNEPEAGDFVYVLCDDGTVWALRVKKGFGSWKPLPALPQDTAQST